MAEWVKMNGILLIAVFLAASTSWGEIVEKPDPDPGNSSAGPEIVEKPDPEPGNSSAGPEIVEKPDPDPGNSSTGSEIVEKPLTYPGNFSEGSEILEKSFNASGGPFKFLQGRVEIGTRFISIELQDDSTELDETENGFLGTIVGLDGEDDLAPTRFFIDILATPYLGLELSYDKLSAETKTSPLVGEVKSDGTLELSGPILSVFARYPNKTGITPYGGVGYAFYSADFNETGHWANGYPNPTAWAEAGSPNEPLGGRSRSIDVDDVTALVIYGGVLWSFHERWAVDVYLRSMDVEVDARFIGSVRGTVETDKTGTFPMDHTGYGLSLHYLF